ncbi:hypothetical protein BGZ80_007441, partial [Entomortierella chlamydospora]
PKLLSPSPQNLGTLQHQAHQQSYNNDVEESECNESDSENNENNNNTNSNHNNCSKRKGVNRDKGMNDKTGKNSLDRFRCQMVISAVTSTEPELRCGRSYVVGNGARTRQRHMDKHHPG